MDFLDSNGHRILPEILDADLPALLDEFYCKAKPIKGENYAIQTLKCIQAGLNRYFKKNRNIDIISDPRFIMANEVFKSVAVDAKKKGMGVVKSTKPISQPDLIKIGDYFKHPHITKPEPKILQQSVLFFIIYYFFHRGGENLYNMEKDWFKLVVDPDGSMYVIQEKDEKDKNHGIQDTTKANDGKMYAIPGNYICIIIMIKFNKQNPSQIKN